MHLVQFYLAVENCENGRPNEFSITRAGWHSHVLTFRLKLYQTIYNPVTSRPYDKIMRNTSVMDWIRKGWKWFMQPRTVR